MLNISTRSVDRYIKSGKLRSKKEGKVVYIKWADVEKLLWKWSFQQEVIVPGEKVETKKQEEQVIASNEVSTWVLDTIYKDLRDEIQKKDGIIQELSVRLWRAEEIATNSVSLIEHKKSQFLLEESKGYLTKEVDELKNENEKLQTELKYEKNSNILLIIFVAVLIVISVTVWFIKI